MTTINTSNEVLQSLSIANQQEKTASNELGKDAFLQLMIAQLKNQDPLSPAKNEDFIAQLAQFSSVEGITNINESLTELSASFRSSQALEASALVGRQVQVSSNTASLLPGGDVNGVIQLNSSTNLLTLTIESFTGEVVQTQELGSQPRGDISFIWDGRNQSGEAMPPGQYRVRATAIMEDGSTEVGVLLGANVNSVTIGQNNEMILNVEGVGAVPFEDVQGFL